MRLFLTGGGYVAGQWAVLAAISLGGGAGGLARYGLGVWLPTGPGDFPWTLFAVNVSGCLLIGILMVLVSQVWSDQRLLRPFLGVGVLGGYTTFSFHMVEAQHLLEQREVMMAVLYLAGTAAAALAAVAAGMAGTRWLISRRSGTSGVAGGPVTIEQVEVIRPVGRQAGL